MPAGRACGRGPKPRPSCLPARACPGWAWGAPAVDARRRAVRAVPEAPALVLTGACLRGVDVAAAGFAAAMEVGEHVALAHPSILRCFEAFALVEAGRVAQSLAAAASAYEL